MNFRGMFAGVVLLSVAAALPASAAVTTYTDRATFLGAAGAVTTETFNNCGPTGGLGAGVSLSSGNPGPCGAIQAGVTFSPHDADNDLYIADVGQSANPTGALGTNFPTGGNLNVSFSGLDTFAFGADLFQNYGGGAQSGSDAPFTYLVTYIGGGTELFSFAVASDVGGFYGLISDTAIANVGIAQTNGYSVIDNASFNGGAVPEPATWAMMLMGFGGLGAMLRSRRKALAA